jgi:hypothetical protein
VPNGSLGLPYDDVLPRGRRFGRLVITVFHNLRLARVRVRTHLSADITGRPAVAIRPDSTGDRALTAA